MSSSSIRRPTIGLISVGQGPRPDLEKLHKAIFSNLGLDARLTSRHALDGLSPEQLTNLEAAGEEPAIHCNTRDAGTAASLLGSDWASRWIRRDGLTPCIQRCIDALEKEEKVDATICCVAEHFEAGSFGSTRPFVLPASVMFSYAQALAATKPKATIGLISYGDRQRRQQKEIWKRQAWADRLNLIFVGENGVDAAAAQLASLHPDLTLAWAYAIGFGPNDPPDRMAALAAKIGTPVIAPAVAASMFARNLLSPPFTTSAVN